MGHGQSRHVREEHLRTDTNIGQDGPIQQTLLKTKDEKKGLRITKQAAENSAACSHFENLR